VSGPDVAGNVAGVRERIAAAARRAGRDVKTVRLIAVAKTKPAGLVHAAIAPGVHDIGENYVQEAVAKRAAVGVGAARWHLIGHLPRNKAARAVETFDTIHTVDSVALAVAIGRHAQQHGRRMPALIEVNVGGEASKRGVTPVALPALLDAIANVHLDVRGLMPVPPPGRPDDSRPYFRKLRALAEAAGLQELSMGMSDDFDVAVEEGATMLRVGRAIFGDR
jgi:PLP dependent protein